MALLNVFQDPRSPHKDRDGLTLQIHSPLPDPVPVGHHEHSGVEVVDEHVERATYLDRVQRACIEHGADYTVRFYDHFGEGFDASVLDQLDQVQSLSIDGMYEVCHPEAVARLPKLRQLNFSPRGKQQPDILSIIGAMRLEHLTLGETFEPPVDLSALGQSRSMRVLRLLSRGRNTEALGECAALVELSMHPTEKIDLAFINRLQQLEVLKLTMGKVRSISAIGSLPALRDLSFHWVNMLEDIGDLQRFPNLRRLQIDLQKRLKVLRVGPANVALEHVNVSGIDRVEGFSELPALKSFNNFDGRFAPDWSELPPTLTHFALVTPSLGKREKHYADVRAHGLNPDLHPDAQFFHK